MRRRTIPMFFPAGVPGNPVDQTRARRKLHEAREPSALEITCFEVEPVVVVDGLVGAHQGPQALRHRYQGLWGSIGSRRNVPPWRAAFELCDRIYVSKNDEMDYPFRAGWRRRGGRVE